MAYAHRSFCDNDKHCGAQRMTRAFLRNIVLATLLCSSFAVTRYVQASIVQAMSLDVLTSKAELIVVGVATERQSRRDESAKHIVTDVSVRVEEVLKGKARVTQNVVITVLGGQLEEDLAVSVPGEASFELGKRVMVFLYRAPRSGDLRVVGMSQGVLSLVEQDGKTMVLPGGGGATLVDRGNDGVLRAAPSALLQPAPLSELRARIRKLSDAK